jgi:hypothetical protein
MNGQTKDRGLAGLTFTREEKRHPAVQKLVAALAEELEIMRIQNDSVQNIEATTVLRGQILCVKRISARTLEVGPESRQSEADGPESASARDPVTGFPKGF